MNRRGFMRRFFSPSGDLNDQPNNQTDQMARKQSNAGLGGRFIFPTTVIETKYATRPRRSVRGPVLTVRAGKCVGCPPHLEHRVHD
jgi:hypothetical protein